MSSSPALERCLRSISTQGATRVFLVSFTPIAAVGCLLLGAVAGWKLGVALAIFVMPMVLLMALGVQLTHVRPMVHRMRAAASRTDEIVWIYDHTTHGSRRGTHDHVTLGLEDGTRVELQTTHLNDEDRQALLDELQARSPHATFGFSPTHAQAFRSDPLIAAPRTAGETGGPRHHRQARRQRPPPRTSARITVATTATTRRSSTAWRSASSSSSLDLCGPASTRASRWACWSNGSERVVYVFDPETRLRTLAIDGPQAEYVRNDLLNLAYIPVLEAKIPVLLESSDRTEVLRALGAIAFLYPNGPGKLYRGALDRLRAHPDGRIRGAVPQPSSSSDA
ncbi:hypothetical protein OV079_52690 [Nannocystis pusilla]|uniref:Uncharacterized protein n=1 Tax=Nannocystis pusilla TaxID=889268 RepID=A0A9X3F0Z4_9BACT|nr:hypothetical protein [Nannocystis pusilla]MCY1014042.1 hypothetical protein [Nannocystis pusilla]